MYGFHEFIEKDVEELKKPDVLAARIVEWELADIGIDLTEAQMREITEQLASPSEPLIFDFDDNQLKAVKIESREKLIEFLDELVDSLPDKISNFVENFDDIICSVFEKTSARTAEEMADDFVNSEDLQDKLGELNTEIELDVISVWGRPLSMFLYLTHTVEGSAERYANRKDQDFENNNVTFALVRLLAKSLQVSKEVITLLRNGYPDGALARWRTLHEMAVIAFFIAENDEELAEMYISHQAIQNYKSANIYNEYAVKYEKTAVDIQDMNDLKVNYDEMVSKYGKEFISDYGWASKILGKKKPYFSDIESSISMDAFRPVYRSASGNVHGNSTGVFNNLGLDHLDDNVVLTGSNILGIALPAQLSIRSLTVASCALFTHCGTADTILVLKVIQECADRIEAEFAKIDELVSHMDSSD